jgi:nitroreductase
MDAFKAIVTKRDRREYQSTPIPDEIVQRILQAGRMAGSSSNSQPIRYVVMRDKSVVEALAPAGRGTAPLLKSPLPIAVLLPSGARDFDVGRSVQNMMIAAWAEGIISCPVGVQDQAAARKALGQPDEYNVAICVAFGYPEPGSPTSRGQKRLDLDEIVHWDRW